MKGKVLVAGFATRHVACSAYRAGYAVYAVDHFCDRDLGWYTQECAKFEDLDQLHDQVLEMSARHAIDILVVTSGAESLGSIAPLYGTPRERIEPFLDKLDIQRFFEDLGIPAPPLSAEGECPAVVKPRRGAGGWRNAVIRTPEELTRWQENWPDVPYITQHLVGGTPASVSCIADGTGARAVAINEQLQRGGEASPYGYSGSITPFFHPLAGRMAALAEQIAAASGCVGSVGIDFMVDRDRVWAIEINPRFQATLDTVEMATGCSVFEMHVDACRGRMPDRMPESRQVSVRSILFADRDMTAATDLSRLSPAVADIPWPGTSFEEGQAVISVYGWGRSREDALCMLDNTITTVHRYMEQW
ncbi:MAG: ATP-grasp domain-containing protein [Methanomicrobiaceae archaeon]|nr:ATP-grasp domain-containing protein [Methanomicrobiaceae archaeon]